MWLYIQNIYGKFQIQKHVGPFYPKHRCEGYFPKQYKIDKGTVYYTKMSREINLKNKNYKQ